MTRWIDTRGIGPQTRRLLLCFPFAGGNAALFGSWQRWLKPDMALCPVLLPGRGVRCAEPPVSSLHHVADQVTADLRPYQHEVVIYGHSLGALLGWEVARRLSSPTDRRLHHLFVAARVAPHCRSRRQLQGKPPLHRLPDALLQAELAQLNGTPAAILENHELMQWILPGIRADFCMLEEYASGSFTPLNVPLTALSGRDDQENTPPAAMEEWRSYTRSTFRHLVLPGGHFFVQTHAQQLCACIEACLNPATADTIDLESLSEQCANP